MVDYSKYLSNTDTSAKMDCRTFEAYKRGEIDIDECFNEYWANNKPRLNRAEFKEWIESLGY